MISCTDYEERISAYADGELSDSDRLSIEEHLAVCDDCSALLAIYRAISVTAKETLVPAPTALSETVMKKILSFDADLGAGSVRKSKTLSIIMSRYVPLAACLALILLTLPNILKFDRSSPVPDHMSALPVAAPMPSAPAAPGSGVDNEGGHIDEADSYSVTGDAGNPVLPMESAEDANADAADVPEPTPEPAPEPAPTPPADPSPDEQRGNEETQPENTHAAAGADIVAESAPDSWAAGGGQDTVEAGYYAVVKITGELPAVLNDTLPEGVDTQWYVMMPRDIAEKYIAEGYSWSIVELDDIDPEEAPAILYWPG